MSIRASFLVLAVVLLLTPSGVWAAPSAAQARALVEEIVAFSLDRDPEVRNSTEWKVIKPHQAVFDPEFFTLLEWCSTPQPDVSGRVWHYGVNPIWQTQDSGVKGLKIGTPKQEGDVQTVVLDYGAPSVRESQPSSRYHTLWIIAELAGRPVLKDIRYYVKHPATTVQGSVLADMRKARKEFRPPDPGLLFPDVDLDPLP
jgi:hypothetical protein